MTVIEAMKKKLPILATYDKFPNGLEGRARSLCYEFNHLPPEKHDRSMEILKELFGTWNPKICIHPAFNCNYGFNIHAEGFLYVNYNCTFLDNAAITFGNNVLVGPGVVISTINHGIHPQQRLMFDDAKPINVGENVWIGANATVLSGVTIGKNSVIGAGSVVTKDIPENVVAVGNPCKVLRPITDADKKTPFEYD